MQPGEVIVVRLKDGPALGRYSATPTQDRQGSRAERIRVAIGRNREAQLPADRLVMSTGLVPSNDQEVEQLRQQAEDLSTQIDLSEVWELAREDAGPVSIDDLADLYWGGSSNLPRKVAIVFHAARETLYFEEVDGGYQARTVESVNEILERRQRESKNSADAAALVEDLSHGRLPELVTGHQQALLGHLRGFAVHGDDYNRGAVATGLLKELDPGSRDLQRLGFDVLVKVGVFSEDEPLELERADIPVEFPEEVVSEANGIDPEAALAEPGRRDLQDVPTITIDEEKTADRDDALSIEIESDGSYRVGIHIADAGALVPPRGAIDTEADRRMSTIYLPELRLPMVPPGVSEGKGSLSAGQPRAALSVIAHISGSGDVLDWEVLPSVIRSQAALSYENAEAAAADPGRPWHEIVLALSKVADALRVKRDAAGAVTIDRPEMAMDLTPDGVEVRIVTRTVARRMVAEFMILCNTLLAEFCKRESLPAAYRSQPTPELGDDVLGLPEGPFSWFLTMRRLLPAELSTSPGPHGSLGVPAYLQATAPIRRYPDMVMQRQISRFLASGRPFYSEEEVASVAQRADVQLREIAGIEEARKRHWFLKYLRQELARTTEGRDRGLFEAVVLDRRPRRPALLELAGYPFRIRAELPDAIGPGESVVVKLHGVDLWHRVAQFVHVPFEPATEVDST
ncbi:MAG: ribonuclease catalytic domain-containing protein [Chloroflexi bacterium]|nr:ribonuclease catalytic domain-containing protein [Chloroflexota bacterium]